jgi:hypothetical protein
MSDPKGARRISRGRMLFVMELGIAVFCLFLFLLFYYQTKPIIGPVSYQYMGKEIHAGFLPLFVDSDGDRMAVSIPLTVSEYRPSLFFVKVDDCLEDLMVNETLMNRSVVSFCDLDAGRVFNIGPFLHTGKNNLQLYVRDYGGKGGLDFSVAHTDPFFLMTQLIMTGFALLISYLIARRFRRARGNPLPWIFIGGAVLRWWYLLATPSYLRSYDVDGHVEYIRFIMDHLNLPLTSQGWEFYQPPLYYILGALWAKGSLLLGHSAGQVFSTDLQMLSLLISFLTFALALWIGAMLFPGKNQRGSLILYACLLAVLPGLVYFSPRINNDILVQFLMFLFFAIILRWWRDEEHDRGWIAASIVASLALLTKTNAMVLFAIAWGLLLFRRVPWRRKVMLLGMSVVIALLFTDWFFIQRFVIERNVSLVGNIGNLNGALHLENTLPHLLIFDPIFALMHPLNNPWADDQGRQFFWSYLFRSAFVGEFPFPDSLLPIIRSMLFFAIVTVPLAVFGAYRGARRRFRNRLPLLLCLLGLLGIAFMFRVRIPNSPSEDFRFIVLLTVPMTAFAIDGAAALPRWLRWPAYGLLWGLFASCAAFFLTIIFTT